jgi:hypothetical protein
MFEVDCSGHTPLEDYSIKPGNYSATKAQRHEEFIE